MSADLLRRAAVRLRDPYRCNNDPAVDAALAKLLDGWAAVHEDHPTSLPVDPDLLGLARAILREEA